jgi:hypothetical protein
MMSFGKKSHMLNPITGKRNKYPRRKSMYRIKHDLRVEHHNNNNSSSSSRHHNNQSEQQQQQQHSSNNSCDQHERKYALS